jgi:hypothetical protein
LKYGEDALVNSGYPSTPVSPIKTATQGAVLLKYGEATGVGAVGPVQLRITRVGLLFNFYPYLVY